LHQQLHNLIAGDCSESWTTETGIKITTLSASCVMLDDILEWAQCLVDTGSTVWHGLRNFIMFEDYSSLQ